MESISSCSPARSCVPGASLRRTNTVNAAPARSGRSSAYSRTRSAVAMAELRLGHAGQHVDEVVRPAAGLAQPGAERGQHRFGPFAERPGEGVGQLPRAGGAQQFEGGVEVPVAVVGDTQQERRRRRVQGQIAGTSQQSACGAAEVFPVPRSYRARRTSRVPYSAAAIRRRLRSSYAQRSTARHSAAGSS